MGFALSAIVAIFVQIGTGEEAILFSPGCLSFFHERSLPAHEALGAG
jgi:hypothetical protein